MILRMGWEFSCWSYQDMWLEGQRSQKSQYGSAHSYGGWCWVLVVPQLSPGLGFG